VADSFSQRLNLLGPEEHLSLEGGTLVRRTGKGEQRLALAELREARISRHPLGPHTSRLVLQLRFQGRRPMPLTSHSITAVGRFRDDTAAFRGFALELLRRAPQARLARGGSAAVNSAWLIIVGLGFGALVMVGAAAAGGALALGLDLGARMVFLVLIAASALPWLGRAARLDRLTPEELLTG
jgi:hypothetical protein